MARSDTMTVQSGHGVGAFIAAVASERKRADSEKLIEIMSRATAEPAAMWGTIVGFGRYHYRYESGHEGDSCLVGFSPRKAAISIYLHGTHYADVAAERDALLSRLGRHTMGKGCLYVKTLADVDLSVLEELVRLSVQSLRGRYPG